MRVVTRTVLGFTLARLKVAVTEGVWPAELKIEPELLLELIWATVAIAVTVPRKVWSGCARALSCNWCCGASRTGVLLPRFQQLVISDCFRGVRIIRIEAPPSARTSSHVVRAANWHTGPRSKAAERQRQW